jgi:hypothetical protein
MPQPTPRIEPTDTVVWSPNQLATEIDGEVVLMNMQRGHYYGLDDIGSEIWRSIERPTSVAALCHTLSERYHAPRETVLSDVVPLLEKLREQDLIVVVEA